MESLDNPNNQSFFPVTDPLSSCAALALSHTEISQRCEGIRARFEELLGHETHNDDDNDNDNNDDNTAAHVATRQKSRLRVKDSKDDAMKAMSVGEESAIPSDNGCTDPDDSFSESSSHGCCLSTFWGAVVNLCSATLGAGVLSLPHACAQAGLVVSFLLLVISAAATAWSIQLLVQASTFYQLYTYESLAQVLYGQRMRTAVELSIVLFCQGCSVAYLIAVADILEQADLLILGSRAYSMIIIWACILLPLSMFKTITALQLSSAVGLASIGTLVFAAIVHLMDDTKRVEHEHDTNTTILLLLLSSQSQLGNTTNHSDPTTVDWSTMLWPQKGFFSILTTCPIILFAFSCQVNVCSIYEELPPPPGTGGNIAKKQQLMKRVASTAVAICALLYASISIATLADFGVEGVTPNILNAYHPVPLQGIMQVAATGMALAVIMAFPLNIFPARVTLEGIWEQRCPRATMPTMIQRGVLCDNRNEEQVVSCCCPFRRNLNLRNRDCFANEPNSSLTEALLEEQNVEEQLVVPLEDTSHPHTEGNCVQESQPLRDLDNGSPEHAANDEANVPSWFRHIFLTLLLAGTALGIALVAPNISVVFQIIGGTATSVLGFCVPGLLGLRLGRDLQDGTNSAITCFSWLLLYGGMIVGALTTAVTIFQIATET